MKKKLIESISGLLTFYNQKFDDADFSDISIDDTTKQELLNQIQKAQASAELQRMMEIIKKIENQNRPNKLW